MSGREMSQGIVQGKCPDPVAAACCYWNVAVSAKEHQSERNCARGIPTSVPTHFGPYPHTSTSLLAHFAPGALWSMPSSVLTHFSLSHFGPHCTHFCPEISVQTEHGPKWVGTELDIELAHDAKLSAHREWLDVGRSPS